MRSEYDEQLREYYALASKRAVLKSEKSPHDLEASQVYQELERQFESAQNQVDETVTGFNDADFKAAFRELEV